MKNSSEFFGSHGEIEIRAKAKHRARKISTGGAKGTSNSGGKRVTMAAALQATERARKGKR